MNNDLEQFSEERLKNIIELADNPTMTALSRIVLSAKQAKPVVNIGFKDGWPIPELVAIVAGSEKLSDGFHDLYTTPQPAHTEQDGWKLVPIEPTQEMVDAHISGMQSAGFSRAYRDMLAAAPKPESE